MDTTCDRVVAIKVNVIVNTDTAAVALSPDNTTYTTLFTTTPGVVGSDVYNVICPAGWYVKVTVTGSDPIRVAQAANTVAAIYEEYAREGAQTRAQRRSQFIAQSLEEQAVSLKRSQDSLRDFQERNKTSDVTDEQTELFKRIYKLQDDRAELMLEQQVYLALVGRLAQADTTDARRALGHQALAGGKLHQIGRPARAEISRRPFRRF